MTATNSEALTKYIKEILKQLKYYQPTTIIHNPPYMLICWDTIDKSDLNYLTVIADTDLQNHEALVQKIQDCINYNNICHQDYNK